MYKFVLRSGRKWLLPGSTGARATASFHALFLSHNVPYMFILRSHITSRICNNTESYRHHTFWLDLTEKMWMLSHLECDSMHWNCFQRADILFRHIEIDLGMLKLILICWNWSWHADIILNTLKLILTLWNLFRYLCYTPHSVRRLIHIHYVKLINYVATRGSRSGSVYVVWGLILQIVFVNKVAYASGCMGK